MCALAEADTLLQKRDASYALGVDRFFTDLHGIRALPPPKPCSMTDIVTYMSSPQRAEE